MSLTQAQPVVPWEYAMMFAHCVAAAPLLSLRVVE